jgi:hypothetical protein
MGRLQASRPEGLALTREDLRELGTIVDDWLSTRQ